MKHILVTVMILIATCAMSEAAIYATTANGKKVSSSSITTLAQAAVAPTFAGRVVHYSGALSPSYSNISSATLHQWPDDRGLVADNGGTINPSTTFRLNPISVKETAPEWFAGGLEQAARCANGVPIVLRGRYTGNSIDLPTNTSIIAASPSATVTITGTGAIFSVKAGVSNILIKGVTFISALASDYALTAMGVTNLVMEDNRAIGLALLRTYQSKGSYTLMLDSDLSDGIIVRNNECRGASVSDPGGDAAIALYYAKNVVVSGNLVANYTHGIQWWGGSSSPNLGDGLLSNARKAYNIVVAGNNVHDIGAGCIWGSMGERVSVTGNTVATCGDVGIDFEGGFYNTATGNVVKDCNNGGLVTYYYVKGILFSGNHVTSSTTGKNLVMHNNLVGGVSSMASKDITLTGNSFECLAANSLCKVTGDGAENLAITGNTFKNVYISSMNDSLRTVDVSDNIMTFTDAKPSAFTAINLYYAHLGMGVKGNTVRSFATQPAGSVGVQMSTYSDGGGEFNHRISSNTVVGFPADIGVADTGGTGAWRVSVTDNSMGAGVFVRGGTALEAHLDNNHDRYGNYWPDVIPGAGTWDAGTKIYYSAPAAGAYVGAVCTTAGTPGTWKTFGAVAP